MAYRNKIISNPVTGQSIRFLHTAKDTGGKWLEMESTYMAGSLEPPAHYHPLQEEYFTVISGELTLRVEGQLMNLKAGDELHIPARTIHAMWNASGEKTVVNWKVIPALNTEYLLETGMGLAAEGKTDSKGMPRFLQVVLMADRFNTEFRLSRPPFVLQKLVFTMLKPIGRLAGYREIYQRYID